MKARQCNRRPTMNKWSWTEKFPRLYNTQISQLLTIVNKYKVACSSASKTLGDVPLIHLDTGGITLSVSQSCRFIFWNSEFLFMCRQLTNWGDGFRKHWFNFLSSVSLRHQCVSGSWLELLYILGQKAWSVTRIKHHGAWSNLHATFFTAAKCKIDQFKRYSKKCVY